MRTGQSRHKPIWLNYAQWLLGPTRRWRSWDRNETSYICLFRVTELSEFFCFDTNQWVTPPVGICVTDRLSQLWKSHFVRAVCLWVWMFPVGWHSLHVWEEFALCSPPPPHRVPSLFWCALVVLSQTRWTSCSMPTRHWLTWSSVTLFACFYKACLFELLQNRVSFTKCVISFPKLLVKMHFQLVTVADQLSCTNLLHVVLHQEWNIGKLKHFWHTSSLMF